MLANWICGPNFNVLKTKAEPTRAMQGVKGWRLGLMTQQLNRMGPT